MKTTLTNFALCFFFVLCSLRSNVASAQSNPFAGSYSGKYTYSIAGDAGKKTGTGTFTAQVSSQGHVVVKYPPVSFEFDINTSGRARLTGKFYGAYNGGTGIGSINFTKHNNRKVVSGALTLTTEDTDEDDGKKVSNIRFSGQGPVDTSVSPGAKVSPFAGSYSGKFKALSAKGASFSGDVSINVDKMGGVTIVGLIGVPGIVNFTINSSGSAHLICITGRKPNKWDERLYSIDCQIQFKLAKNGAATFSGKGYIKHLDGKIDTATFSGAGTTASSQTIARAIVRNPSTCPVVK